MSVKEFWDFIPTRTLLLLLALGTGWMARDYVFDFRPKVSEVEVVAGDVNELEIRLKRDVTDLDTRISREIQVLRNRQVELVSQVSAMGGGFFVKPNLDGASEEALPNPENNTIR